MAKKDLGKGLSDFLQGEIKKIASGVKSKEILDPIGSGVIQEMKTMISKGISPIEGAGRFPEYKAPSRSRSLKSHASAALKDAKEISSKSAFSRRQSRQFSNKAKSLKKTADQVKKRGYPYSVQKKFPQKRNRPVNLFLSGDFLKNLKKFLTGSGDLTKLEIGFKQGSLYSDMEEGHRVGVNKQPKRPIIPNDSEKFAQRIQRVVEKILGQELAKRLRSR